MSKKIFFLGGQDLEMKEIRRVLERAGENFVDKSLSWGAHASDYSSEIAEAISEGLTPILIELDNKFKPASEYAPEKKPVDLPQGVIIVDHHGDHAGRPQSLIQVLELLGQKPNREQELISLNDEGYIPAMLNAGASPEEAMEIRQKDREVQGITPEQEQESERAIKEALKTPSGLYLIKQEHSKSAPVTDRMFFIQGKDQNLLILSQDGESNFFGTPEMCQKLNQEFPGGWTGGLATKANAFWGHSSVNQKDVESFLVG